MEMWWLIGASQPPKRYAGGMTEAEVAALYERAYGSDEPQQVARYGWRGD